VVAIRQYDRGVRVTILPPQDLAGPGRGEITINARPPLQGVPQEPQIHVQAQVQRSLGPSPGTATIRLYNLAQTTRDQISGTVRSLARWRPSAPVVNVDGLLRAGGQEQTSTLAGMAAVRIDAGWSGALEPIFVGTVVRPPRHYRQGPLRVTELQCSDGGFGQAVSCPSKAFGPQTPATAILDYLAGVLGCTVAQTQGLAALAGFKLSQPVTVFGDAAQGITDLCDPLRLTWWTEAGDLYVLADGESLPGQAVVVTPQEIPGAIRLYAEPEPADDGALRITCALASSIRCGHLVTVAATEQRGTYRVESLGHVVDNRGGAFATSAVIRNPTAALGL
jgi:hypothetical protein